MTRDYVDLLPCPFCGGERMDLRRDGSLRWVACETCGADGPVGDSFEEVERLWNERAHNLHAVRLARLEAALGDVLRIWSERRRDGENEHEHTASRLERIAQLVRRLEGGQG